MNRVRLFLDIDGVLNAVGRPCTDWQEWSTTECSGFVITHAADLGRSLAALDLDIHWLTSWRHDANVWIAPLFGWPELPVVPDQAHVDWQVGWWKLVALRRLHFADPRPFIWADDDLGEFGEAVAWCRLAGGLPIVPDIEQGLTRAHLDQMRTYVDAHR